MSWLYGKPAKSPPEPGHVHLEALMGVAANLEAQGATTPVLAYVRANGPKQSVDKWGQALPLSAVEQAKLDRMFAILSEPYARGMALLKSGMLLPDEVDALATAHPDAWMLIALPTWNEMHIAPPPYPMWVEQVLGVLFRVPAPVAFQAPAPKQPNPQQQANMQGPTPSAALPTQADRRDAAVRSGT